MQIIGLDLDVDETLYLIRPLEVTEGYMALVPEPYQHRIETGSRLCRSFQGIRTLLNALTWAESLRSWRCQIPERVPQLPKVLSQGSKAAGARR